MRHILTLFTALLFIGDQILNISTEIWLCSFAGWFTFLLLHFEYTHAKITSNGKQWSWRQYWADNGVHIGISLLVVAPSTYVFNSIDVLTPLTAFTFGYFNIHAIRQVVKRARYGDGTKDSIGDR